MRRRPGPLIALGRIEAFDIIGQLPIRFIAPRQVRPRSRPGLALATLSSYRPGSLYGQSGWIDLVHTLVHTS
jgi:hypothetical protein